MIPNPTYGSWLGAIYEYEWGMTPDEKRQRRREVLDVFAP
jgi:predicted secreted acid phosphatase